MLVVVATAVLLLAVLVLYVAVGPSVRGARSVRHTVGGSRGKGAVVGPRVDVGWQRRSRVAPERGGKWARHPKALAPQKASEDAGDLSPTLAERLGVSPPVPGQMPHKLEQSFRIMGLPPPGTKISPEKAQAFIGQEDDRQRALP